ncbi:hypothetical protein [Streptococcus azizii]|nr:hypothetical protein [Streptococcus azizii]
MENVLSEFIKSVIEEADKRDTAMILAIAALVNAYKNISSFD